MLEESIRKQYLSAMGVDEWQVRSDDTLEATSDTTQTQENTVQDQIVEPEHTMSSTSLKDDPTYVKGLKSLNQYSKNGLMVLLPDQRKELSPESRMLMSKMLKSIHFLPSETEFAVIGEAYKIGRAHV